MKIIITRNSTNKELLYGDADKDGTPNIDDKYPYDKTRKEQVNPEVRLYDDLIKINNKRKQAAIILLKQQYNKTGKYQGNTIYAHNGFTARIKDTRSIIHKSLQKAQYNTNDLIGIRKETITRNQAQKEWTKYNKTIGANKKETDNKYKTNKGTNNPYRAFHTNTTIYKKGAPYGVEAQFRTKQYGILNDAMHAAYKTGKANSTSFLKKGKELIRKGY